MNRRLIIIGLFAGYLVGCSSGSKKVEQEAAKPATEAGQASAVIDDTPVAAPVDTSRRALRSLDKKYEPLTQALRSGQSEQISHEAATLLSSNPNDPIALNALGMSYFKRGKLGAAKLLITRAFERNPPSAALHNNLGIILLGEGEEGAALGNFKRALKLDQDHPEALGNLGSMYLHGGDVGKALPLLTRAHDLNGKNVTFANNYALALRMSGKFEAAAKIYDEVLKVEPRHVQALVNYAILLVDYLRRPKDGLSYIDRAKVLEIESKELKARINELENKARSALN